MYHTKMHVRTYIQKGATCTYVRTYICNTYVHTTTPMRTHQHQCTHTVHTQHVYVLHMLRCMYICTYVCMCKWVQHAHNHAHTHAQTAASYTSNTKLHIHNYNAMFQTHSTTADSTCCLCTRRPTQVPDTRNALHITQSALHITQSHLTYKRMSHVTDTCLSWQTSPLAPISAT